MALAHRMDVRYNGNNKGRTTLCRDAGGTGELHHYLHHQEEQTDAGDDFDVRHVAS